MNKVLISGSVLVVVIVYVIYVVYYSKRESFFVAYNNFDVPINKQDSLNESDIRYLNSVFDEYNTSNFPDIFNQYTKYTNSKFDLQTVFSKAITDKLNDIFSKQDKYKGDKIKVVGDIYDLYWKDVNKDRDYIFKINITDESKKWTRSFKIYLIVKNTGDINIKTISLEESSEYLSVGGIEKDDYKNYYMIQNTLHLMDPYLTSRKDMIISDKMKYDFKKILLAKLKTKI